MKALPHMISAVYFRYLSVLHGTATIFSTDASFDLHMNQTYFLFCFHGVGINCTYSPYILFSKITVE